MEEFLWNPFLLTLTPLLSLIFLYKIFFKPSTGTRLQPPSPPKLPIIGNLHQLSSLPHRDLHSLSKKHGPIMLLHFGSVPVLVASSAELARDITRTHDLAFANRPQFKAMRKLLYGCRDISTAPYGDYWRRMKSIFVMQMLSSKRVQAFRSIWEEETALFVKEIEEGSGRPLNLSEMFVKANVDTVYRTTFGRRNGDSENGRRFLREMTVFMELLGFINIGDFIPWLGWIGCVNGFEKKLDATSKEMDQVLESLIEDQQQIRKEHGVNERDEEYFVDILLDIYDDKDVDVSIDRDSMKALLLNVFIGGTDTISTALEWAMSELLRNPTEMEKLQREVRKIVEGKQHVADEDLEKMHYLKAVIKEALRLHPPLPLLGPRVSTKDVQVKGYNISTGTVVMINAWAIARDPILWDEPEKFMPERFLNSSIDYKGLDFELIPFGAGRRGCPGITYGAATVELVLANLVQKFDWELPSGVRANDLDMSESPGVTAHRVIPLVAVASRIK